MFVLKSDITIGDFKRVKPTEVKVTKSIFEYCDKAMIKIPISARIKRAGEVITESVETAKTITEGMKVSINLGYNTSMNNEFEGFVARVNFTTPCEIECEGYSYLLRKNTYKKTFKKAQLLDILQYLVDGTGIVLDRTNIPSFIIEKMVLDNHSGTEALEIIKKESDNTIRIYFNKNVLFAGLVGLPIKATVKYRLGWNVIKDGNLKLRQAKNQDVTVHYISEQRDGTKKKVTSGKAAGSTGENKVIKTHSITDDDSLKMMADAKLQQLSYDGYEGKITAFLLPYCEPGYKANMDDPKYVERGGNYLTESTEVTFKTSGARRIAGIGLKL